MQIQANTDDNVGGTDALTSPHRRRRQGDAWTPR